jgi:hypothetical protein
MAVVWVACGVPVYGDWKYLYRAIDRMAALADVALSEHRNLARGHDELRNLLGSRSRMCQHVPAATRRFHYMRRTAPSRSVSWNLLEQEAPQPENFAESRLESWRTPAVVSALPHQHSDIFTRDRQRAE